MRKFFDNNLLLGGVTAQKLYEQVKGLPIIDYHCHLDQKQIAEDVRFENIGKLWLGADHYKWRAMRLCGVDENYITGKADWKEKFLQFAAIMPKLFGGPLYYWSHLELKQIFGINQPLNSNSAEEIWESANEQLKNFSVQKLLKKFNVEYIATTDDPSDDFVDHKVYGTLTVAPTFRPDKILSFDTSALLALGTAAKVSIDSFSKIKQALSKRLDYFVQKGGKISDHGFLEFPDSYVDDETAEAIYANNRTEGLRGNLMLWLMREYKRRNIVVQLHFSVVRNINSPMFHRVGVDTGFDVMSGECDYARIRNFLNAIPDEDRPKIIMYSLNPNDTSVLANLSGAFRNIYIGAPWWFNDTLEGIRTHLSILAEYAVLGTNLGMLTDSRSFLSYSRFDFFRRILCDYVGTKVDAGEYDEAAANTLLTDICYQNIKNLLQGAGGK